MSCEWKRLTGSKCNQPPQHHIVGETALCAFSYYCCLWCITGSAQSVSGWCSEPVRLDFINSENTNGNNLPGHQVCQQASKKCSNKQQSRPHLAWSYKHHHTRPAWARTSVFSHTSEKHLTEGKTAPNTNLLLPLNRTKDSPLPQSPRGQ